MTDYRDYAAQMKLALEDIKFLQKLKKDVDPASCMSVSVRRGVPQDNADVEDDDTRRPWRTMSFRGTDTRGGGLADMYRLIDLLIADRVQSLKLGIKAGAEYTQEICKADQAAQQLLREYGL